jgi:hypothetical protein
VDNRALLNALAMCTALGLGAFGTVRVVQLGSMSGELQEAATRATGDIAKARDATVHELRQKAVQAVAASTDDIVKSKLQDFQERLGAVTADIEKQRQELAALEQNRERLSKGLPGAVDLDELGRYYAEILKNDNQYSSPAERFRTSVGEITFSESNIQVVRLPSDGSAVWVKIGKDSTAENAELLRAWISEAERAKTRLGYVREYRRVLPADYGEVAESLFRKGDLYFKTYLQYQRIQGTYGRHSLEYTYYVETGSVSRKDRYELEQYNKKLGS